MNVVHSVSFPRSGHRFTTELLQAYFGPALVYSGEPAPPEANFIKHHDQDGALEVDPNGHYLVQVRDPFDAVWSWYKMTVDLDGIPDTIQSYRGIFLEKLDYWTGFMRKWVLSDLPNRVIVKYYDLVTHPAKSLRRVLPLFGEYPDRARVEKAVREVAVIERRTPNFYLQ